MPADVTGTSNSQDHCIAEDSDDESFDTTDKEQEALGEHDGIQEHAFVRPADDQPHSNGPTRPAPIRTPLESPNKMTKGKEVVTWMSLPHKRQLAILTAARLSEPLVQTSLQSYMFYQLKSFDKSLPDSVIASQAGFMQGSFTVAQFLTAVMWGRIADSDRGGRKTVIMIGLLGACKSWT